MKIRIFGCIMLSFWLLCSTHHRVAFALSESDILKVISTRDKALNQGSIELSKTSAQVQSGSTRSPLVSKEKLIYSKQQHFLRYISPITNGREGQTLKVLYDGQNEFIFSDSGTQVSITKGPSADLAEHNIWFNLYPGACFVLGRGLSTLQNPKIHQRSGNVIFTGAATDGTRVEAVLDSQRDFLAQKIERKNERGRVIGRLLLSNPLKVEGHIIASKATYEAYTNGESKPSKVNFAISHATFVAPRTDFNLVLRKGSLVVDSRLGEPITWNMGLDLTPSQLLKRTTAKAREVEELRVRERRANGLLKAANISLLCLPAVLALTALVYLRRKRSSF